MASIDPHDRDRWLKLVARYADRVITPAELADLQQGIRESTKVRELCWEYLRWNTLLLTWGASGHAGAARIRPVGRRAGGRVVPGRWVGLLTAAVALSFVLGWFGVRFAFQQEWRRPRASVVADVAIISGMQNVRWESAPAVCGQSFGPRRLVLAAGEIQVGLTSGVDVAVRGPAEFSVLSGDRLELVRGSLVARVPTGAEGFTVSAPTVDVVDLGTEFGVRSLGGDGAEVVVFQGRVEAQSRSSFNAAAEILSVNMGKRFMSDGRSQAIPAILPDQYPLLSRRGDGVPVTSGAVRFLASPPSDLARLASNEFVAMFRESAGVTVPRGTPIDIAEPGIYSALRELRATADGGGRKVDSYLLRFASRDNLPSLSADGLVLEGSVTFPRPIVGILCLKPSLDATDRTFARVGPDSPKASWFRGLELDVGDHLVLSTDRKTLWISFRVQGHSDQIRVLVEPDA